VEASQAVVITVASVLACLSDFVHCRCLLQNRCLLYAMFAMYAMYACVQLRAHAGLKADGMAAAWLLAADVETIKRSQQMSCSRVRAERSASVCTLLGWNLRTHARTPTVTGFCGVCVVLPICCLPTNDCQNVP